jgi:hypothetical protein
VAAKRARPKRPHSEPERCSHTSATRL